MHINWESCLSTNNNNPAIAREILVLFLAEIPQLKAQLHSAISNKDIEKSASITHKFQGSCAYCGALTLRDQLEKLEKALNKKEMTSLSPMLNELDITIDKTIDSINTILKEHDKQ